MIYQEEIIVCPDVLNPSEIWQEIGGFLQSRGHLGGFYDVNLGMMKKGSNDIGVTKRLAYHEVERELKLDEGMPDFWASCPPKTGIMPLQTLTYTGQKYKLNLSGKYEHFPDEWDSFFMTSHIGENLVNVLIHPKSFRRSLRQYKTPPENDLIKAPGLANDRGAYLEGVAAEMWFGESFWQYAACSKEDVLACDWLKCQDRRFQLHVEAWPEPFTSAEGEQGEVQRRLLELLFDITPKRNPKMPPPIPKVD